MNGESVGDNRLRQQRQRQLKQLRQIQPEEDDYRQRDPLYNDPGLNPVVVLLQDGVLGLLQSKGVRRPGAKVQQDKEGDSLKDILEFPKSANQPVGRVGSSAPFQPSCPSRPR